MSRVHQKIGRDLQSQTRAYTKRIRRSVYDSWVKNRATNSTGDQSSSYSNLYNTFVICWG